MIAALTGAHPAWAAPFAAYVMDARTGQVLYQKNAETPLHPASLTKMLTLYICFDAIRRGEISLDTMVTVSRDAADEPPSHLGLRVGQKISLRYLIRAAAVKSANDAAVAIADAISGSVPAFAKRMNATAKKLGMTHSHFLNPNGLTLTGHLSTARDMAVLGRHLLYDFPEYYNLFSRRKTFAGVAEVYNTNRRFLNAYRGADGIKTGYTSASGFNLVASAKRGETRIIAAEFGGTSVAGRNAKMAELLDIGFARAPAHAPLRKPKAPNLDLIASAGMNSSRVVRLATAVTISPRPQPRPDTGDIAPAQPPKALVMAMKDEISNALGKVASATPAPAETPQPAAAEQVAAVAPKLSPAPEARPDTPDTPASAGAPPPTPEESGGAPVILATAHTPTPAPVPAPETGAIVGVEPTSAEVAPPAARPDDGGGILFASVAPSQTPMPEARPEIVTRLSTSGGRNWAINVGRFSSSYLAEKALMRTALTESSALHDSLRKVVRRPTGYDANFIGLTQDQADLACARLQARGVQCFSLAPPSG